MKYYMIYEDWIGIYFPVLPHIVHSSYYNTIHNDGNRVQKDAFFYEM